MGIPQLHLVHPGPLEQRKQCHFCVSPRCCSFIKASIILGMFSLGTFDAGQGELSCLHLQIRWWIGFGMIKHGDRNDWNTPFDELRGSIRESTIVTLRWSSVMMVWLMGWLLRTTRDRSSSEISCQRGSACLRILKVLVIYRLVILASEG